MKKLLMLAVLMTGCHLAAGAQATLPSSYYVSKAKQQLQSEEAAKFEDLVVIYTRNGALTAVVRDGDVVTYPENNGNKVNFTVPYYWKTEKSDSVAMWRKQILQFAKLQEELEAERFEIYNSFASKDGEVFVYRRRVKK